MSTCMLLAIIVVAVAAAAACTAMLALGWDIDSTEK